MIISRMNVLKSCCNLWNHLMIFWWSSYNHLLIILQSSCAHLMMMLQLSFSHFALILKQSFDHLAIILWTSYVQLMINNLKRGVWTSLYPNPLIKSHNYYKAKPKKFWTGFIKHRPTTLKILEIIEAWVDFKNTILELDW